MDGPSAKKSNSLETLVIQNITNVNDLKAKLNDIITVGKNYEYDVSNCLSALLRNSDHEIVTLAVQAISELAKCEDKRETFAKKEVIEPILDMLGKEMNSDRLELAKQSCRALGNLCCDCDTSREILLDYGVSVITKLLKTSLDNPNLNDIKIFTLKTLLNYGIGGNQFAQSLIESGVIELMRRILVLELDSEDMDDDLVSTVLLVLSVMNDNNPLEFQLEDDVNLLVLRVLRETANMEISELCLDHLLLQAEHESVKTLLARSDGVQQVCSRLEALLQRQASRELRAADSEVDALVKQACDLLVIVLTGDEAMHLLYDNGRGAIYETTVRWLDSANPHLLATAVLAIGNFARQDDYCARMMETHIFEKLLDIFEHHHKLRLELKQGKTPSIDMATVIKVQHAALSALRNLTVSPANKKVAASKGRAAPVLLNALPHVEDHHVAYKLLAALRMLVDGQESVARQLAGDRAALGAVARWGAAGHAGAAGEAPRLLAWSAKQLRGDHWRNYIEVDGCLSCLINMLVASHSVMQNEAILALTLLSIHSLKGKPDIETEKTFIAHLLKSEIGKHVSVLLETNCAKMPIEVVENLLAFLDVTCKVNQIALDYKEAKVYESLQKLMEARSDLSDDLKSCVLNVVGAITNE